MEQCKLQIGCFVIIFYIGFSYFRECKKKYWRIQVRNICVGVAD